MNKKAIRRAIQLHFPNMRCGQLCVIALADNSSNIPSLDVDLFVVDECFRIRAVVVVDVRTRRTNMAWSCTKKKKKREKRCLFVVS